MVELVKSTLQKWIKQLPITKKMSHLANMFSGKMLRTQLASYFINHNGDEAYKSQVLYSCVATEIAHTASLFHDDVIDGASLRRGMPTLWKLTTPNASILVGDILLCEALHFICKCKDIHCTELFSQKLREVCQAETEQELLLRGATLSIDRCLKIARSKTGPLFAFPLIVCANGDSRLESKFEEIGYLIGTAYQLKDDLIDCVGSEKVVGKTLGTDTLRKKFTLAQNSNAHYETITLQIQKICEKINALHTDKYKLFTEFIDKYILIENTFLR